MEPLRWLGTIHTVQRSVKDRIDPPVGVREVRLPKGLAVTEAYAHEWVRFETYRGQRLTFSDKKRLSHLKAAATFSKFLRNSGHAGGVDSQSANRFAVSGAKHMRYYAQIQDQLIASEGPFEFRFGLKEEIDG